MHECPTCGKQTPDGNFCVRCGGPLDHALHRPRERRQFAVAPSENRYVPWLVSSLFPHLPRHSERHFHLALAAGAAVVVAFGAFRLFPVALISAALLMPLLTVLYFYDVDIYEREPVWAIAWTVLWGIVTGALVGVLANAVAPTGEALINRGSTAHVVTGGVLLPILGVLVVLGGPAVLLRGPRFNETLDGATFGAAAAAAFAGAEAVVVGVDVLRGGLRPAGAAVQWVERLVAIAIATPVLSMAAIGAACAALWLRYRAPVADRRALGLLGSPPVAVAVAVLLVVAGAVGETFMASGIWLVWLIALDLAALSLLRRSIHVGLLEESAEKELGATIRCANCAQMTVRHTFCSNCGVALKALPKAIVARAEVQAGERQGEAAGRLSTERGGHRSGRRRLIVYGLALLVIVGVAFAVATLAARPGPMAPCGRGAVCGNPPILSHAVFVFPGDTAWQSTGLGFSLRYPSNDWSLTNQDADDLALQFIDGSVLVVNASPTSSNSPAAMIAAKLSVLRGQLLGLAPDTNSADQVLGTNVGFVPGPGGVYSATVATPEGPSTPVHVAIVAASSHGVTIMVTVVTKENLGSGSPIAQGADDVIDSIQWAAP